MKKQMFAVAATLALAAGLAACGEKKPAEAPAPAEDMMKPGEMPMMKDGDMSGAGAPVASAKTAKGSGEVTAIDKAAGTVTLKHGAIPEAGWPAMTMTFKVNPPTLVDAVKVGDQVNFDLKLEGGANEVTALQPK